MPSKTRELKVDFLGGAVGHRLRFGGGRGQALPRAIGMKGGNTPHIVDATAGLGRDAFLLASLGATVTLIERSEKMHALLQEGMNAARAQNDEIGLIISRMTLIFGDAKDILPDLNPEIILIDPMHPPRKDSALVKRALRQVREIVGTDDDAPQLIKTALQCARKRVVLKWPQKADSMPISIKPSHQITGKSTRYDVFMIPAS